MAKALQCPSCGTKTRLDSHAAGETFSCDRCGQTLKVPPGMGGRRAGGDGPGAPVAAARPSPPRRSRPVMTAGGGVAAGGTAVLSAPAQAPVVAPPMSAPPARGAFGGGGGGRDALPLPVRIGVWVLALPIGLAVVGIPARAAGYLSSQKLLDVIVKRDLGRFVPLLAIVALWALVTAVLVTVFVEGGRRLMLRRQSKDLGAAPGVVTPSPSAPPPPRRRRGGR